MTEEQHLYYMQKVINLAQTVSTQTRPNPRVACIIVKNNQIVGIGVHLLKGREHAEVYALNQAGSDAIGATLYVNLEPCSHHGSTPPCADAIVKAGIKQVIIANQDPNPLVAGQGIAKLKQAGINVVVGTLADEAFQINKVFFHNITQNTPYTMLKVGMSIDGRIATKANISKWITCNESRQDAHEYRAKHDGILIGVDSVIHDNPSLTPYLVKNANHKPVRIILDSNLRTPLDAQLITDTSATTWIITQNNNSETISQYTAYNHITIIHVNEMNLHRIMQELYLRGIYTLMVEGGEKIYSSFIDNKLVNEIVTYISPQIIGSTNAKHFVAGNGFETLQDNLKLKIVETKQLATDFKVVYEVIA